MLILYCNYLILYLYDKVDNDDDDDDDDGGSGNITIDNLEQHLAIINENNLLVTEKDIVTVDDIIRSCENDGSMTGNKLIII